MDSVVYFVERKSDGLIKIGCTKNLKKRMSQLHCKHGDIEILGITPGRFEKEKEIHSLFSQLRNGKGNDEFFRDDMPMREYIEKFTTLDGVDRTNFIKNKRPTSQSQEMLDTNQVIRIVGWTYPTAKRWVVENGGKMVDNGAGVGKWVISHETVSNFIKEEEKAAMDKRARYWAEMRTTEVNES